MPPVDGGPPREVMKDGVILTPVPSICSRDCEKSLLLLRPGDAVTPDKQGLPSHQQFPVNGRDPQRVDNEKTQDTSDKPLRLEHSPTVLQNSPRT
ncbi:hypothetical protein R6Z07M_017304 [Ovis aries]